MSAVVTQYKILPQAWPAEKRRIFRQTGLICAVLYGVAAAVFVALMIRGTRESVIVFAITFALIGCFALPAGLGLGFFLRKMIFLDGRIETDGANVWWHDFMPQKKYALSLVTAGTYNEAIGIVLQLKSGKTARLPGPVENQEDLLAGLARG
jgi:hypothetical protein